MYSYFKKCCKVSTALLVSSLLDRRLGNIVIYEIFLQIIDIVEHKTLIPLILNPKLHVTGFN